MSIAVNDGCMMIDIKCHMMPPGSKDLPRGRVVPKTPTKTNSNQGSAPSELISPVTGVAQPDAPQHTTNAALQGKHTLEYAAASATGTLPDAIAGELTAGNGADPTPICGDLRATSQPPDHRHAPLDAQALRDLLTRVSGRWGDLALLPIALHLLTVRMAAAQNSSIPLGIGDDDMELQVPYPSFVHAPLSRDLPSDASDAIRFFLSKSRAPSTFRGWRTNWTRVLIYAERLNVCPLPMTPDAAAGILGRMALDGYAFGTLCNTRNVMAVAHRLARLPDPTRDPEIFEPTFRGIVRHVGAANVNRKAALTIDQLREMMPLIDKRPPLERSLTRVVLTSGLFGAFRRSEIAAFDVRDCALQKDGVLYIVRRSKTDQIGAGKPVFVGARPTEPLICPRRAMQEWLELLDAKSGPLFRHVTFTDITAEPISAKVINRMVKRYARRIGLDPRQLGAHSLRAGFITAVLDKKIAEERIARHTRHEDLNSILRYYRPNEYHNFTEDVI